MDTIMDRIVPASRYGSNSVPATSLKARGISSVGGASAGSVGVARVVGVGGASAGSAGVAMGSGVGGRTIIVAMVIL
jgi:hypothetical protein